MTDNEIETDDKTQFANKGGDSPTYYSDGVQGAVVSAHTARINFIEDFMDPSDNIVKRRVAFMLVLPRHQLGPIANLLQKMGSDEPPPGSN